MYLHPQTVRTVVYAHDHMKARQTMSAKPEGNRQALGKEYVHTHTHTHTHRERERERERDWSVEEQA